MKRAVLFILAASLAGGTPVYLRAAEETNTFKDFREKLSYAIGMNVGENLKRGGFEPDVELLKSGIADALKGETRMTEQQSREVQNEFRTQQMKKREEERKKLADKNKAEGDAFLAANKQKAGVKTHAVTLPDGATAELQYKVITAGSGATPKSNDTVIVNYRGTLVNGNEFDNSAKTGRPAEFPVNMVVRGWTEALQMMPVGSKWEVYLPAALAYGERGRPPQIEPGATLIFEMELVGIKEPAAPAPAVQAQPLTSDIIRVPSAEELKRGAQIEILKPEEAERRAREEAEKKKKEAEAKK